MTPRKPKILLLVDKHDWAYDHSAKSIQSLLSDEFDFQIAYIADGPPDVAAIDCDLIHVFWWGETWHHALKLPPARVLKEVSSFRWREESQFGLLDPKSFINRYLTDAATIVVTSQKMKDTLNSYRPVLYTPNGIDPEIFYPTGTRSGAFKVGWAGNIKDACKGIQDIIMPACHGDFQLVIAPGNITSRDVMRDFYNQIDVFCVASTAEGEPLTILEALACGCFQIAVDVGIVPEVIQPRINGFIVNRSVAAFRAALTWCHSNVATLRQRAPSIAAELHKTRSWQQTAPLWRDAYRQALTGINQQQGAVS